MAFPGSGLRGTCGGTTSRQDENRAAYADSQLQTQLYVKSTPLSQRRHQNVISELSGATID